MTDGPAAAQARLPPRTIGSDRNRMGRPGSSTTPNKWRAFADIVAGALGANVWISMILLPSIYVAPTAGTHVPGPSRILAMLLPLLVLALGLRRRSEAFLLAAFPAALLVPIALEPHLVSASGNSPVRLAVVAGGIVAYLFGVSYFTTFHEPPAPLSTRTLSSALAPPPPRWLRRERVYSELTVLSIVVPLALIGFVNHSADLATYIGAMYPGQHTLMTTTLTAGTLVLWLGIYRYAVLGILRPHRTGDRDLIAVLQRTRGAIRTGTLGRSFYVAVGIALLAMVMLVVVRGRG